jgi:flagellin
MTSVNTNYGASIALQNLARTNDQLEATQNRINTGLKVASAKDNGAIFNISQKMRGDVQSFGSVQRSLDRTLSVVDTAIAAGTNISDLLRDMKEKALAARDTTIDATARRAYHEDFTALRNMITTTLTNAAFDGSNLANSATNLSALANAAGTSFLTVTARNMSLGGSIVTLASTASISTSSKAATALTTIETSLNNLNLALSQLGTDSKKVSMHKNFVSKLVDELNNGIGNLVDADLARESANLSALQTKQQLGVQALSIANQAPQMLLALFR